MEQKVFFANSKGVKLCGIFSRTPDKDQPLVILVHGFSSQKNTKNFSLLRELLEGKGYATFRFDIFGHGESGGNFEDLTLSEATDDILQSIMLAKKEGFSRIGLVGSSFGGNASELAAARTNDLKVLALKSPVSNYLDRTLKMMKPEEIEDWKKKGYRTIEDDGKFLKLNYSYFEDFKDNIGYEAASRIRIPTMIVHGTADASVPVEQSVTMSKLLPNCELELITGANHTYSDPGHYREMSQKIARFIFRYLPL